MSAFNFTFTFDWSHLNDALQIAILYFVFYGILKAARGSRFGQVLLGVAILFGGLLVFTFLFHFYVLALIIKWILIYLAISTVVLFQPEIRRVLATAPRQSSSWNACSTSRRGSLARSSRSSGRSPSGATRRRGLR